MLDVIIASDSNYLHLVSTCVVSFFETNPDEKLHLHLLSNGIGEGELGTLKIMIEEHQGALSIYPLENLRERLTVNVPDTISVTSYARLFASSILPPSLDKVLYIDCDIIFNGAIKELFNEDLGNSLVGGVLDPLISRTYKREIRIPMEEPYVNAGVLLIPLNRWRSEGIEQQFVDYLVANGGKVHHHDQGIINAVCVGRKKILPPQFNVMSNSLCYPWNNLYKINTPFYNQEEYKNGISCPAIIHFTGAIYGRPWIVGCTHPYTNKFLQFKVTTTYKDMPLRPNKQSILHRLEGTLYRLLPFGLFKRYIQSIYYLSYFKHSIKNKIQPIDRKNKKWERIIVS